GNQWSSQIIGTANSNPAVLTIDRLAPNTLYEGMNFGGAGVYKSTDSGATWNLLSTPLTNPTCPALVVDPTNSSIVYAALNVSAGQANGVYKSTDGGATWTASSSGLNNNQVSALAIDPQT